MTNPAANDSGSTSAKPRWISESDVRNEWSTLFKDGRTAESFEKAERLIDSIRPESPLRFRLVTELAELRKMKA